MLAFIMVMKMIIKMGRMGMLIIIKMENQEISTTNQLGNLT